MRIISSILVAALIGVLVGGALAYVEVRSDPDALGKLANAMPTPPLPGGIQTAPRVEAPETHYNFGKMARGTSMSHDFVIRNVGTAPLKLPFSRTTCKCTLSKLPSAPIPPGGSAKVTLEWS